MIAGGCNHRFDLAQVLTKNSVTELGSVSIWAMSIIAVMSLLLGVGIPVGGRLLAVSFQADTAAEAVALAVAPATFPPTKLDDPHKVAHRFAQENGAILERCDCSLTERWAPREVTVEVSIPVDVPIWGEIQFRGIARARFDPIMWITGSQLPPPQKFPFRLGGPS